MTETTILKEATKVAAAWGTIAKPLRLIAHRENVVFEMHLSDGTRAALRLHRDGYQSKAAIEDELTWTSALAQDGFPCPVPISAKSGNLIENTSKGLVTCVSWIDAVPFSTLKLTNKERANSFEKLGALLALLHQKTQTIGITARARPDWTKSGLVGANPHWGRFWETPASGSKASDSLHAARAAATEWLEANANLEVGLIHADAIGENVLGSADDLALIDFDDSGHGYLLYELGVALTQRWDKPDFDTLCAAIAQGYATERNKNAAEIADMLPVFTALRCLASAGWIKTRIPPDNPGYQTYINRAVSMAERVFSV